MANTNHNDYCFFSMGRDTFRVPVEEVFVANRTKLLQQIDPRAVCYMTGGPSTTRFDSDHEPLFRQESYFWYLTGVKEPDCSVVLLPPNRTVLFVPRLPHEYATIMGSIRTLDEWKSIYLVDDVQYTDTVETFLEQLFLLDETKQLWLVQGLNSDSGKHYEPPVLERQLLRDRSNTTRLFAMLAECRVSKSDAELQLLRHVTEVTSFGHVYTMRHMRPGMMEYQGESLFRHYCYYQYGCRHVGYTSICGCGPNAAILHYGHAGEPNARQSAPSDTCLFDMGAEYFGYGSDVTCSFPVSGKFNDLQKPIYQAVLDAQVSVYEMIRPGVSWTDCHKAAEAAILKRLEAIGVVKLNGKTLSDLVEMRLGAVFMPHGLGHFIGIDTHDVGGYLEGHPERSNLPGLKSLRTARTLKESMTLTVEPGCYFIDHLLDEALQSDSHAQHLDKEVLASYRGFGGVRFEDVVVVTKTGCDNFTLCPRTIAEIEAVMSNEPWPPSVDTAPELRRRRLTAAQDEPLSFDS